MAICDFQNALLRCVDAPSPMALFRTHLNGVEVLFADTILTSTRITFGDPSYITTIKPNTAINEVRLVLLQAFDS